MFSYSHFELELEPCFDRDFQLSKFCQDLDETECASAFQVAYPQCPEYSKVREIIGVLQDGLDGDKEWFGNIFLFFLHNEIDFTNVG